ncbi:hypothetical protein OOZ51_18755 [Arthrobacter sp. MI7-26]|uniref:hypothetical protein n=1 Tax=Arthrobacter sp. MI7-26 TaxID=2993653 RepID=UPI0022499726|nr:hypothetical protein [Arthrobacter sp. MI7-26]MCX2749833.1 hypothetical protein [Arthrobacter sp. MI7-26]
MTVGIDPRNGVFWPIEYKSHKDVLPSDELELAFYWVTGWTSPPGRHNPGLADHTSGHPVLAGTCTRPASLRCDHATPRVGY